MSSATAQDPATEAIMRDWRSVRADDSIQYAPLPELPQPDTPEWLERLLKWLAEALGPAGEWWGANWATTKWLLAALGVALALYLLWRLIAPLLGRRGKVAADEGEWRPDETEALALLDDADALAAQGRFDEAAHLLLKRSIGQIGLARPDWLDPSTTSREITRLPALPDRAKQAFTIIAARVERSIFALHPLDKADWDAARGAYADFAMAGLAAARE